MPQNTEGLTADDGILDLEKLAKANQAVPPFAPGTQYRIRIDKALFVVSVSCMTGAQILDLVGKSADAYRLDMKLRGGATQKIEPNQEVDFTMPGVEKFMTLPLDQTDGTRPAEDGPHEH